MTGIFNDRALHAEADAEEGNLFLTGIADGFNLAFHSPVAEAAWHQDAVAFGKGSFYIVRRDFLGIDVAQIHGDMVGHTCMGKSLMQAFVGLLQFNVFAHDGDGYLACGMVEIIDELTPGRKIGVARGQAEHDGDFLIKALVIELERNFIHIFHINGGKDGVFVHVAEKGYLAPDIRRDGLFTAAENNIGLDADGKQLLYAVLGGLGLVLARRTQVGHESEMDVQAVVPAEFGPQLAHGFEERQTFDVAYRAADFDQRHVRGIVALSQTEYGALYLPSLLGDHIEIDAPGSRVVFLGKGHAQITLIVSEIEIGFRSVVGNEDFSMLKRAHGARIDIDIRVQLLDGDGKPARLEQRAQGRRRKALAEGGENAAGDENELGLHQNFLVVFFLPGGRYLTGRRSPGGFSVSGNSRRPRSGAVLSGTNAQ